MTVRARPRSLVRWAAVTVALAAAVGGGWVATAGDGSGSAAPTDRPAGAGPGPRPAPSEDWISRSDDDAVFTVDCRFSHRAHDDPIVHPGRPGASHSHEFFGSTATDASSTGAALQGTSTTCEDRHDTAAYWVPTLAVDGIPVEPTVLRAYYRARRGVDVRDVTAPPVGLAMISGHPDAPAAGADAHGAPAPVPSAPGDGHHHHGGSEAGRPAPPTPSGDQVVDVGWGCGLRPRQLRPAPPTNCTETSLLTLQLRFPDCWDGQNLDSPDHRGHVTRSVHGACPSSHPVLMTELQVSVSWPVTGTDASRVSLDSGSMAGAHGDFLNGWDATALERLVDLCVRAKANCTIG